MAAIPTCSRCKRVKSIKVRRQIAANGAVQVGWYCLDCDRFATPSSPFLAHNLVNEWISSGRLKCSSINDIPLIADHRSGVNCQVCGSNGAEFHHWLPQAFAEVVGNFNQWPTGYLCKDCHDTWHELVTPYLPGRGGTPLTTYTVDKYFSRYSKGQKAA